MKNFIQHSIKIALSVALIALGSACKKSDSPEPPKPENGKVAIENPALVTALKEQGFTFEGNTLVVNDKVRTTTSLNLSGKQLTDVKGLEAFPALSEVNLSNNKFAQEFDFAALPATVKSVNLSGNELYDFKNLAATDYSDNAQEPYKLIRSFDKLVLPATAKYNMDVLPAYVKLAPKSDVQMLNAQGTAEKYTTLREVPDAMLLRYIKQNFPSVITNDKIDISKDLKMEERGKAIVLDQTIQKDPNAIDTSKILNVEGIEYIFNNPHFGASIIIEMTVSKTVTFPYVKIGKNVDSFVINWINTPFIDFSNNEGLGMFGVSNNSSLKKIDLSTSKVIMQKGAESHDFFGRVTALQINNCSVLEEIIFPDVSKAPSPISAYNISLLNLPLLKTNVDISKLQVVQEIKLGGIPNAKIIYPTHKFSYYLNGGDVDNDSGYLRFEITEDIFNLPQTKEFIKPYVTDGKIKDGISSNTPTPFKESPSLTKYHYLSNITGRAGFSSKEEIVSSKYRDIFSHLKEKARNK